MTGPHEARQRDLVKCEDMRLYAQRAMRFLGQRNLEQFLADDMIQDAVVRCVEVIGEAARLISEETRKLAPGVPWPLIVGMRHILAHDYGAVNLEKVHDVASRHLPLLVAELAAVIRALEEEVGWSEEQGEPPPQ